MLVYHIRKGNEKDMKVGDLIKNKTRYVRQKFLVIDIRTEKTYGVKSELTKVRAIRMPDGFKTRWSLIDGWEVISECR